MFLGLFHYFQLVMIFCDVGGKIPILDHKYDTGVNFAP
ncbi:hypothetical protein Q7O_000215 [Pectobacterium carotovorum subsp. carotovorum PCCS1]|jgi:hypothetical protein|nr:hypothetical protein [Pectobacterium carotovorum subsp. carotovorum PCCS1]